MYPEQHFSLITPEQLTDQASEKKEQGFRLAQICCTCVEEGFELLYSFAGERELENLRLIIPKDQEIQSISGIFWSAFLYENEMKDLFGVKIKHIALDFNGHFFKLSEKTPWNPQTAEEGEVE